MSGLTRALLDKALSNWLDTAVACCRVLGGELAPKSRNWGWNPVALDLAFGQQVSFPL